MSASGMHAASRPAVLLAADRAAWEPATIAGLRAAGIPVLRRCVDMADLLAVARVHSAQVAVIDASLPGLDADAVGQLAAADLRVLVVLEQGAGEEEIERLHRLGAGVVTQLDTLPALVESLTANPLPPAPGAVVPRGTGRRVVVWGPAGAPGRTTVAIGLAARRAAGGSATVLVDADPYAGSVAQRLGVLDEVSGLLAAARLVNHGRLDAPGLSDCLRSVAERLEVLTGLPRPDRWIEVREGVLETVIDLAARRADVVVDGGFCLEEGHHPGTGRNTMTREAVLGADDLVLVGSAEPTGLSRLIRALVELTDLAPRARPRVVVNRMRESLGWRRADLVGMVEGYAPGVPVSFLPHDLAALDRVLVAGGTLVESGDSPLRRALAALGDAVFAPVPATS